MLILCSGVFDGLHAGHLGYLQKAAWYLEPTEQFWVAVAPDEYVTRAKRKRPQWAGVDRFAVMQALRMVDRVVVHSRTGAADAILKHRPRLFVKGVDWRGTLPHDVLDACRRVNCEIAFVESGVKQHTSDLASEYSS